MANILNQDNEGTRWQLKKKYHLRKTYLLKTYTDCLNLMHSNLGLLICYQFKDFKKALKH